MKKSLTILFLLLLATPIILAEENITDQAQEGLSALKGGLDLKTENVLEREINFPPILKAPLKLILGIEEDATWQQLIVVLGVFIGFFILIFSITGLFPFFKEDLIKVAASLVITALVSITGALNILATWFYDMAGFIKWASSWGPLQMIFAILIAAIFIYVVNWISHKIKKKMKIEKASETGKKIKEGSESAEIFTEAQEELSKNK